MNRFDIALGKNPVTSGTVFHAVIQDYVDYVQEDVRRTELIYRALGIPEEYIPRSPR